MMQFIPHMYLRIYIIPELIKNYIIKDIFKMPALEVKIIRGC